MKELFTYRMLCLFCCCLSLELVAQQEWSSTQYLFNLYDVNVAYAGNHHSLSAAIRHRSQWTGIDGAPRTQSVSLHAPVANERLAWGLRVHRETIGAREQWMSRASLAYRIPRRDGSFSFALAGGIIRQELDPSGITAQDWNDPQLDGQHWMSTSLTFDAAAFIHGAKWFAGLEANRLNRSEMKWTDNAQARSFLHANLIGGRYFKLSENDMLALTSIVRFSEPSFLSAEVNVSYLWKNLVWLGAGYRYLSGPLFLAEINVTRQFRIGYSYDMNTGALRGHQDGSHEVFIGYNLRPRDDKSIRYF
jgi:type IX secretion system PorP/SprF family membrane protein